VGKNTHSPNHAEGKLREDPHSHAEHFVKEKGRGGDEEHTLRKEEREEGGSLCSGHGKGKAAISFDT